MENMKINHLKRFNESDENLNISDVSESDFILDILKDIIKSKTKKTVDYMDEYMTHEELQRHGDNIFNCLVNEGDIAYIRLKLMAVGRK
jgi:cell division ATPase FtsA